MSVGVGSGHGGMVRRKRIMGAPTSGVQIVGKSIAYSTVPQQPFTLEVWHRPLGVFPDVPHGMMCLANKAQVGGAGFPPRAGFQMYLQNQYAPYYGFLGATTGTCEFIPFTQIYGSNNAFFGTGLPGIEPWGAIAYDDPGDDSLVADPGWHYYCVTHDVWDPLPADGITSGHVGPACFFVDAVPGTYRAFASSGPWQNHAPLIIGPGAFALGLGLYFSPQAGGLGGPATQAGDYCRAAFYNRGLDDATVAAHYAAGLTSVSAYDALVMSNPHLVSYWPLSDATGADLTGRNPGAMGAVPGQNLPPGIDPPAPGSAAGPAGAGATRMGGTFVATETGPGYVFTSLVVPSSPSLYDGDPLPFISASGPPVTTPGQVGTGPGSSGVRRHG